MLYVGTKTHLEELDRSYTVAEDTEVVALAASPGEPGEVFALLDGERVDQVGELELSPRYKIAPPAGQSLALTTDGRQLVGLAGAHILLATRDGAVEVVSSFDSVPGRDSWENPAGPTPDLRSLAVASDGTWFAGAHVGGLWRSRDSGATWENLVEPKADVHQVLAGEAGLVCVAAAGGFGWSEDGGESWSWSSEGLHAPYCRAVALDGTTVYLGASTGPRGEDGRLYRAEIGGAFEQCTSGLPPSFPFNIETATLAAGRGQVAFGTSSGDVYRSGDGGASFERVAAEMRPVRCLLLV